MYEYIKYKPKQTIHKIKNFMYVLQKQINYFNLSFSYNYRYNAYKYTQKT